MFFSACAKLALRLTQILFVTVIAYGVEYTAWVNIYLSPVDNKLLFVILNKIYVKHNNNYYLGD